MNKTLALLAFIILAASCKKDGAVENQIEVPAFSDENWMRIELPDGGEALAVAGSIDDTLLVTTMYNTYMVTDNGTKFSLTKQHLNNTPGLLVVKDTIFALNGSTYDEKSGKHYASAASYYTLDKGLTWHGNIRNPFQRRTEIGLVTDKDNVTYKLKYSTGPYEKIPGFTFVLRTGIYKIKDGLESPLEHPIKDHQPKNLYLDNKGRLYIPTGGSFDDAGVYIGASIFSPVYIYISKEPMSSKKQ